MGQGSPASRRCSGTDSLAETYGKLPMLFEANNGQTDEQVKFIARGRGYTLFLTPSESVFVSLTGRKHQLP